MNGMKALLLIVLFPLVASAGSARVSWKPPVQKTDGTTLTDLAGFHVYYGKVAGNLSGTLTVANPAATTTVVDGLTAGQWYFAVDAFVASGQTSENSAIASATVTDAEPTCSAQPATESRSQACVAPTVGSWTQTRSYSAAAAPACWTAGPWLPETAPVGACTTAAPLVTQGGYAYCATGTATTPSMTAIGLIVAGLPCGPSTRTLSGVKFCKIAPAQADMILFCKGAETLPNGAWARAAP